MNVYSTDFSCNSKKKIRSVNVSQVMSLFSNTSPWLTLKEESFIFDELLVQSRCNGLGETEQEDKAPSSDDQINVCDTMSRSHFRRNSSLCRL
jgi:hypothetical protein